MSGGATNAKTKKETVIARLLWIAETGLEPAKSGVIIRRIGAWKHFFGQGGLNVIEFFVPVKPVPMARPRVTRTGHAYTPKNCVEYKSLISIFARDAMRGREIYDGEVWVEISFYYMTPTSWSKKKRESMTGEGMTSRPDIDNLYKAVTDALSGIVYRDDSQITRALMRKQYNENDSGVLITVGRKEDFPKSWR